MNEASINDESFTLKNHKSAVTVLIPDIISLENCEKWCHFVPTHPTSTKSIESVPIDFGTLPQINLINN